MKLVNAKGRIMKVGDRVKSFRGEEAVIECILPPKKEDEVGKVVTTHGEQYVTVYGLQFVEREEVQYGVHD